MHSLGYGTDGGVIEGVRVCNPEALENSVQVLTGQRLAEVTLSRRSVNKAVKIPADGILRRMAIPDDPEKPQLLTLARARVPESVSISKRSQKGRAAWTWERMIRLGGKYLPRVRVIHPYHSLKPQSLGNPT